MFADLEQINTRPQPFSCYTAEALWTDEYTSQQMLTYHLNDGVDLSSRNATFIDRSVAWIVSRFDVGEGTRIADFGCGPGLYAHRLAQNRARVTGIDFSQRSLAYAHNLAEAQGLAITYVHQNYLEFETEDRFDLILMIMCDFCVLSPDQRKQMLRKFHAMLKPDGAVLLDVNSLAAFEQREEAAGYEVNQLDSFWSPHKYYGFVNTFKYDSDKVVLDKYTLVEAARVRTVYNWFQYFSVDSLQQEFEDCGFEVAEVYGDVAGSPFSAEGDEFAVVARKR